MAARVTLAPCVQARDVRSARSDPCILGTRARKYARRQGRARFPNRLDTGALGCACLGSGQAFAFPHRAGGLPPQARLGGAP